MTDLRTTRREAGLAVRSLCVITRVFGGDGPEDATVAGARAAGARGVAVHVICASPGQVSETLVEAAVIVHHVALSPGDAQRWGEVAAAEYRALDRRVDFEVVLLAGDDDLPGLTVGPGTTLVLGEFPAHLETLPVPARLPDTSRAPTHMAPTLAIIVCCGAAHRGARRVVAGVLAHTAVPFRLVVATDTPADAVPSWLENLRDPRLQVLTGCGTLAMGRNAALGVLDGFGELVVFLDANTEVLAGWWEGFAAVLSTDPDAGIVGEHGWSLAFDPHGPVIGVRGPGGAAPCDAVAPTCAVMRRDTLSRLGRFDERLDVYAQMLDLCVRARRVGARTWCAATGLVIDLNPPGVVELTPAERAVIGAKHARQALSATTPFLLLVRAEELLGDPALLADYGAAFTADDEVALVVFGPGADPVRFEEGIAAAAERAGFNLESGPRVIALLPPVASAEDERAVAEEVAAVLSGQAPVGPFADLAWLPAGDPAALRDLAARLWRARPT